MSYSKLGKSTSINRPANKRPSDPIDRLIHENGLRIRDVYIDRTLDLLLLVPNNGQVLRSGIEEHKLLRKASRKQFEGWQLIAGGTGVTRPALDEDLSLRGFINASLVDHAVKNLSMPTRKPLMRTKQLARKA